MNKPHHNFSSVKKNIMERCRNSPYTDLILKQGDDAQA